MTVKNDDLHDDVIIERCFALKINANAHVKSKTHLIDWN